MVRIKGCSWVGPAYAAMRNRSPAHQGSEGSEDGIKSGAAERKGVLFFRLFQSQESDITGDRLPQSQQLQAVAHVGGRVAEYRFAKLFFQANRAGQA